MINRIEKNLGKLLVLCIILIVTITTSIAGSDRERGSPGESVGGDTMGGQPSCRC